MLERIAEGRTDLVFDYVAQGHAASTKDANGVTLLHWCAYYGDVSAIRFLLANGESPDTLGPHALNGAAFHGHWRLCEFLLENSADPNLALPDTGETPLHAAICTTDRSSHDLVVALLLANGAEVNRATKPSVETGAFMRDCRTKGETPLHRAAAFGNEQTIQLLLDRGAIVDAKDMNGDTPLSWGSWYARPDAILRKLCYGEHFVHPNRKSMKANLIGTPRI
jgi:uncharacterized protein